MHADSNSLQGGNILTTFVTQLLLREPSFEIPGMVTAPLTVDKFAENRIYLSSGVAGRENVEPS